MEIRCQRCGKVIREDSFCCENCGHTILNDSEDKDNINSANFENLEIQKDVFKIKCPNCNSIISTEDIYCKNCGKKLIYEHKPAPYTIMIIFWCWFLYWGAVHHGIFSIQAIKVIIGICISWILFEKFRQKNNAFWANLWGIIVLLFCIFPGFFIFGIIFIFGYIISIFK